MSCSLGTIRSVIHDPVQRISHGCAQRTTECSRQDYHLAGNSGDAGAIVDMYAQQSADPIAMVGHAPHLAVGEEQPRPVAAVADAIAFFAQPNAEAGGASR